ncbi:hypothetical protein [Paraglaciecola sp. 20A4]|uniref:hypothetical protein n=1 Tax=Paraglaciecola sp. 20A4 TaxID=2687288 RepID=UPI001409AE2F|nr:hypothetical protein [Paraglaciecola sp. 20A4]
MNNENKNKYFNWFDKVNRQQPNDEDFIERLVQENALLKKILLQKEQEAVESAV